MFCYPLLGLLSGVMPHLQLHALVILNPGNTKVRCDPFLPILAVLLGVEATLKLLPLVIPYAGTLRYDMTFVLALLLYINTCQFCYPFLLPLFGLLSGVKSSLRYLHWPVRTRRSLSHAMSMILILVLLHKLITILLPPFYPFWGCCQG